MDSTRKAKIATAIEKLVDQYGWGGLCDGIESLCVEYYEGEHKLIAQVRLAVWDMREALTARCPDAPGSHEN